MLAIMTAEPVLTPMQALVLGIVQGLSELLPISSSAHLYLVPTLLGWPYAGVAYDVAMHAGTLAALVAAFLGDWLALARGLVAPPGPERREARRLFAMLAGATVPALIAGKLLDEWSESLRSVPLQAGMLAVFGILLWWVDRTARARESLTHLSARPEGAVTAPGWPTALAVGFAQCLALIPGVSRSGITMTAGRACGLSRLATARFSFMLSMPITLAAVVYKGVFDSDGLFTSVPPLTLAVGLLGSAVSGFLAIRLMLGLLRRTGFGVFAAYRVVLALALVVWMARG